MSNLQIDGIADPCGDIELWWRRQRNPGGGAARAVREAANLAMRLRIRGKLVLGGVRDRKNLADQ